MMLIAWPKKAALKKDFKKPSRQRKFHKKYCLLCGSHIELAEDLKSRKKAETIFHSRVKPALV